MIGFDLDGVLVSDLNWPDGLTLDKFLQMRADVPFANFIPKGKYVIVTGRNSSDYRYTMLWIEKNLSDNPPYKVFHDCEHYSKAAEYKAKVINENGIRVFIESDKNQVEYLRENCPNCKVYHYGSFLSEAFSNL